LPDDYVNLAAIEPAGNSRTGQVKSDWKWPATGGTIPRVLCLATEPAGLAAGGDFTMVADESVRSLARFISVRLLPGDAVPADVWMRYGR
jgi:hypothetical protein